MNIFSTLYFLCIYIELQYMQYIMYQTIHVENLYSMCAKQSLMISLYFPEKVLGEITHKVLLLHIYNANTCWYLYPTHT